MNDGNARERTGMIARTRDVETLARLYPSFETNALRLTAAMADLEQLHLERDARRATLRAKGAGGVI